MNWDLFFGIAAAILTILSIIFGAKLLKFKNIIKEIKDVLEAVTDAFDDDKVTKDELKRIVKELAEAKQAVLALFK